NEAEIANQAAKHGPEAEIRQLLVLQQARDGQVKTLQSELDVRKLLTQQLPEGPVKDLAVQRDEAAQKAIDALKISVTGAAFAQQKLNLELETTNRLFAEEQLEDQKVADLQAAGAITDLEALEKLDQVRQRAVERLRDQIAKDKELAEQAGDSEAGKQARLRV